MPVLPLPPNHSRKCVLLYKASSIYVMFPESIFRVSALGYSSAPSPCQPDFYQSDTLPEKKKN